MTVSLDSRLVKSGDYFVPIIGENFDSHKFIDTAIANGAAGIIEVDEMYKIASEKLAKINPKVIAITGSVGKSTMRAFLATILKEKYVICEGTLNTKLGLATNIINDMQNDCEIFIAETGMDYAGELLETGNFIKPHIAVITNISESHLEKLKTIENIKSAKAELLKTVRQNGSIFLNGDDKNILSIRNQAPTHSKVNLYGYSCAINFKQLTQIDIESFPFSFIGKHNCLNVLGAVAISSALDLNSEQIISGLKKLETPKGRLKLLDGINGSILIDDTYNSSPVSAISAIESTSNYYVTKKLTGRKIAIFGGMLELGSFENEGHKKVGSALEANAFTDIILIGELAKKFITDDKQSHNHTLHYCENSDLAGKYVQEHIDPKKGDLLLFKGSQGIRVEKAVKALMADMSAAKDLLVRQDARWI